MEPLSGKQVMVDPSLPACWRAAFLEPYLLRALLRVRSVSVATAGAMVASRPAPVSSSCTSKGNPPSSCSEEHRDLSPEARNPSS